MASDEGSPPLSPGILEASKELEDIIEAIADDPSQINVEDVRHELLRRYDLARRDAGKVTLSRCVRFLKDQSRSVTARVAMMKVLDYLMDVKDGMLAEAIADEKKLDYFKNNAKETKEQERRKHRRSKDVEILQATCELLDKWGRHYESKGAPPNTGGGKIAQAWKDLTKDGVRFPMTYDYLTLTPAPSDAGAFSAAVERHAASSELDEALLGRLADAMQTALERHGRESMEFGEAKAHFESTLEQWQHAVEAAADGDPERFARLFDVVSRYAERQQSIESGATALGAAPLGAAPALPASPSTGSRASREEEAPSEPRSHRRRRRKSAERLPEVATPSFGDWRPEEAASDSLGDGRPGSFGGSFGLQSFPSFGPDGAGFGDPMGPSTFGISDGFGGFGPGDLPDHGSDASFGGDLGPNFGSRMEQPTWSEQPLDPVQEELPDVRPSFAPPAPEQTDQMAELCRKLAQEVQELRSQAENDSSKEEVEALRRRVKELEAQDVSAKKDSTISSLREANMQLQAELDQRGLELSAIRKRALEAERRLSEKDEVFQDTCQRLLDAQRRIAQLEDDLAGQVEVQQSLENRLQGAKALNTATELELKQVRHALGSVTGLDSETRRSNVPYGFPGGDQRPPSPSVSQADELASSMAEKASRLEVDYGGHTGAYLPRSSLQTWKLTPRVRQPGALLRRPASHVIALNTAAHFRQLLGEAQGILYEDHQVLLSMNFHPLQQAGPRQKIHFEVSVSNRGAHPIHDVRLQPAETSNVHPRCFDVQLAPQGASTLWPTTALRFQGSIEVFGVDDIGPQVDLSYLQPDSQSLRARLRLPFTSRFLQVAPKTSPARWDELVHTEVACVCELRKSLVAACTSAWQALEMGGALKCIPGMAGFPGALFAGCFQAPGGEAVELLLHVELGLPDTVEGGQSLCRLAVRSTSAPVNRAVAQAMSLLLRNGHILSCNGGGVVKRTTWLHAEGGRIKSIGSGDPPNVDGDVLDLEGRTVLPGLADSHLHVFALGKATTSVNLEGCKSMEELQSRAREHEEATTPATDDATVPNATLPQRYLEGLGWDQDLLGRTPTRSDLDACVQTPAIFYRRCHHVAVLNSAALKICSITADTEDVEGGVIERDASHEPTGVLREKALELLEPLTNQEESFEVQKDYLLRGLKLCVENGVTFVQSNDSKLLGGISRPWEAYGSLADESKLPCRVFLTVAWQDVGSTAPKAKQFHSSGLLSCDRAKIWTDGGLGAKTAAMLEPYADDPQNSGVMQMSTEEIAKAMGHLKEHGFRVEAHAIGDRAASDLIDAFEKFMPSTERPVLTHCQFLNKNLVERMSKGGIIANVQPQFVPSDLPIIKSRVGEGTERFNYAYVWRTLMKAGVHVAGGSDAPVEAPTPLVGMADAMEHALFASERLTFAEALSMYTTEAAFAACAEERIGTLEPGKDADFVVLDCNTDAEALTASQLRSCQVEKVYVQGKLVHDRTTNAKRRRIATGDGPGKSGLPFVRGRCPACSMTSHRTCSGSR